MAEKGPESGGPPQSEIELDKFYTVQLRAPVFLYFRKNISDSYDRNYMAFLRGCNENRRSEFRDSPLSNLRERMNVVYESLDGDVEFVKMGLSEKDMTVIESSVERPEDFLDAKIYREMMRELKMELDDAKLQANIESFKRRVGRIFRKTK